MLKRDQISDKDVTEKNDKGNKILSIVCNEKRLQNTPRRELLVKNAHGNGKNILKNLEKERDVQPL